MTSTIDGVIALRYNYSMAYKDVIPGVYTITHVNSGRVYVGSAANIYDRWSCHRSSLSSGIKCSPYLGQAWRKYGPDEFEFKIVEVVPDKFDRLSREQYWIDKYQSYNRAKGFNIAPKAHSNLGVKMTKEAIEKRVAKQRGRPRSDEFKEKASAWMKGNRNSAGSYWCGHLREEDIPDIFQAMADGELIESVSERYGVDRASIGRIINRKTWDHVSIPPDLAERAYNMFHGRRAKTLREKHSVLTESDVAIIKRELINGTRPVDLVRRFGVTDGTIYAIRAGKIWKDITPSPPTDTPHHLPTTNTQRDSRSYEGIHAAPVAGMTGR